MKIIYKLKNYFIKKFFVGFFSIRENTLEDNDQDNQLISNMKTNLENEKEKDIKKDSIININIDNFDTNSIFGELLSEQEERIRKFSPFGNFKTWKICRIIGKKLFFPIYIKFI
jgi:hypothetical protein